MVEAQGLAHIHSGFDANNMACTDPRAVTIGIVAV